MQCPAVGGDIVAQTDDALTVAVADAAVVVDHPPPGRSLLVMIVDAVDSDAVFFVELLKTEGQGQQITVFPAEGIDLYRFLQQFHFVIPPSALKGEEDGALFSYL